MQQNKKFFITFGQISPFRDGYVVVEAETEEAARHEAFNVLGQKWASLYTEETMRFEFFPAGQYGHTLVAVPF